MAVCQSPVVFLIVWSISTIIYQSISGYWSSIITTLEEIYHLSSSQIGFLTSFDSVVILIISLPLVYVGKSVHRPRFIFVICLMKAVGTLLLTFPHILNIPSIDQFLNARNEDGEEVFEICKRNQTDHVPDDQCEDVGSLSLLQPPLLWFILSKLMTSVYCAMFPVSVIYLDEGLPKRSTVAYIGIIVALHAVGFSFGYIFAALCLSVPVTPFQLNEEINPEELPGAWWLGYLMMSLLALVTSFLFLMFPSSLPPPEEDTSEEEQQLIETNAGKTLVEESGSSEGYQGIGRSIANFFATLMKIGTNPVVVLLAISGGVFVFGTESVGVFAPLFIQEYYNLPPTEVSLIAGLQALVSYVIGQLVGAFLIRHFDLNRLQCAVFYFLGNFLFCIFVTSHLLIKCPDEENNGFVGYSGVHPGLTYTDTNTSSLSECNMYCSCSDVFQPVCVDGVSYQTPCLAGCSEVTFSDDIPTFHDCSCVAGTKNSLVSTGEAVAGVCREECYAWIIYACVSTVTYFIISATGNTVLVIILRSTEKAEKELTFSTMHITMKLLGFIPGPIVLGWVIDQACLITSGTSCQEENEGNCVLYDRKKLRQLFYGVPSGVFFLNLFLVVLITMIIWRQESRRGFKNAKPSSANE